MLCEDVDWNEVLEKGVDYYSQALDSFNGEFSSLYNPNVGDLAYETSNPFTPYKGLGFIIAVDYNSGDPKYWILSPVDKKIITWRNCKFIKIKGHSLYEYEDLMQIEKDNNKNKDDK